MERQIRWYKNYHWLGGNEQDRVCVWEIGTTDLEVKLQVVNKP